MVLLASCLVQPPACKVRGGTWNVPVGAWRGGVVRGWRAMCATSRAGRLAARTEDVYFASPNPVTMVLML